MRKSAVRVCLLVFTLVTGFVAGHLSAAQPMMQSALRHLKSARADLNKATADKGGHRAKALDAVNEAIDQVEKGIAYDRRR